MNTVRAARNLIVKYRAIEEAERPVDRNRARFAFQAQCDVMWALGFGMTPTHVWSVVQEATRFDANERPGYNASDNRAQQDYDTALATTLGATLDTLLAA